MTIRASLARVLVAALAIVPLAPGAAPARTVSVPSTLAVIDGLAALAGARTAVKQCLPNLCAFRVADDETIVVPDTCDATLQSQCASDCQILRADCETGHDDSLPCETNYTTCASNCAVMAGCVN